MKYSVKSGRLFLYLGSFLSMILLGMFFPKAYGQCPTTNLVENPEEFVWTYHPVTANNLEAYYSGVMEVGEANFVINGETFTTRAYRQKDGAYSIPGPTIKVEPGNKYVLRLHNTLPFEPLSPDHNVFKDPNAVNIHTHGLHISGVSPGDDVTRVFEGGRGGDYVWDIPANHMGGTYWYHAHHHGSTFLQVSGGMFGMLIVDDSNDGIPANVAAMEEREMIFGFLDPGAAGTGGDQLMGGTLTPTWTVNGLMGGNICIPPNTWQHWRILVADADAMMRTIEFGPECEIMLLARDGVWRTVAPKDLSLNKLELSGASRADIAIRTSGDSWVTIGGNLVGNIHTNGTPDTSVNPFNSDGVSAWSAIRPNYLRDLRNETNVNFESVSMGARTINGSKFNHDVPNISLPANQVQEWSLSGAVQHPFHLHVYHVQALADDGDFEAGEYYDVVSAKMSVRFDLNQNTSSVYAGRTILHCHILGHEDRGAMGWLDVTGGSGPPTFPVDGDLTDTYSAYYTLGGTPLPPSSPGNLLATAASSSSIDLTWVDQSDNEDGFNIERSSDGTNFNLVSSVGAGVEVFSNSGLTASTTYYYRVTSFNTAGTSTPSNVANATTFSSGGDVLLHVEDITVLREALKGNRFRAVATITIYGNSGAVAGAIVSGNFTGPNSGSFSGTTDINGQVSFNSGGSKNPSGEWCFEVTDVSMAGATYDFGSNVVTIACESGPALKSGTIINNPMAEMVNSLDVYPNPFQNTIQVEFHLPQEAKVTIEVYSVLGKRISVIADRNFEEGQHFLDWSAGNLNVGTYYLKMKAGQQIKTKRLILAR